MDTKSALEDARAMIAFLSQELDAARDERNAETRKSAELLVAWNLAQTTGANLIRLSRKLLDERDAALAERDAANTKLLDALNCIGGVWETVNPYVTVTDRDTRGDDE